MQSTSLKITTTPDDLQEGLFGQLVLYVFELLPYLEQHAIFPVWDIKSRLYGREPDFTVLPGVFDLAYVPGDTVYKEANFNELREKHVSVLGGDWHYMHKLWHSYFAIPPRIQTEAEKVNIGTKTLGVHYRGTDKNKANWDTNPVSQNDFIALIKDFLQGHPEINSLFIATDEFSFVENASHELSRLRVVNLGEVRSHKILDHSPQKGDRALLDAVLLSRCGYLLKCSSALSGFAKVLNPELEAYRVSASKLFLDIPYFPEAYIPKLTSTDPQCSKILKKLFANDWLSHCVANYRFNRPFRTRCRPYAPLTKLKVWFYSHLP